MGGAEPNTSDPDSDSIATAERLGILVNVGTSWETEMTFHEAKIAAFSYVLPLHSVGSAVAPWALRRTARPPLLDGAVGCVMVVMGVQVDGCRW